MAVVEEVRSRQRRLHSTWVVCDYCHRDVLLNSVLSPFTEAGKMYCDFHGKCLHDICWGCVLCDKHGGGDTRYRCPVCEDNEKEDAEIRKANEDKWKSGVIENAETSASIHAKLDEILTSLRNVGENIRTDLASISYRLPSYYDKSSAQTPTSCNWVHDNKS